MRRWLTIGMAMAFAAGHARAEGRWAWRPINTAGEAAWTALVFVDWSQTRGPGFRENGPFRFMFADSAGRVDKTRLNLSCLVSLAVHAGVSAALPRPYREWWQVATVIVETGNVGMNFRLGARMSF